VGMYLIVGNLLSDFQDIILLKRTKSGREDEAPVELLTRRRLDGSKSWY